MNILKKDSPLIEKGATTKIELWTKLNLKIKSTVDKNYLLTLLTNILFKSNFSNFNQNSSTFLQETNSFGSLFHILTDR